MTDDPYVDDGGEQLLPFPIRVDKDVPPGYVELHDEDGIVKRIGPFSPHPKAVPVCPHCHTSCERGFCSCGWVVPDSERVWPVEDTR